MTPKINNMTIAYWGEEGTTMLSVDNENNTISLMEWDYNLNVFVIQKSWDKDFFLEHLKKLPTEVHNNSNDTGIEHDVEVTFLDGSKEMTLQPKSKPVLNK